MSSPLIVGVHEAKTQLSRILHDVEAGAEVLVTRGGRPVARITPVAPRTRVADSRGMFRGQAPFPDDDPDEADAMGDLFGLPR